MSRRAGESVPATPTSTRIGASLLALGLILAVVCTVASVQAAGEVCPVCGAPLQPDAAFCVACGTRLERSASAAPAAARPDPRAGVVQVVAVHDSELTSTWASLAYESNLRVDSILGSAFAVGPGEFITDAGLLVGAREVSLRVPAVGSVPARVLGSDMMIGVALLKTERTDLPVLPLRPGPVAAGETLTALGFAADTRAGAEAVTSAGVVSALHRGGAGIHPIEDYLQTDASLPAGLAGGPMVDEQGRVVGMSTGFVFGSEVSLGPKSGIGYAVPVEWVDRSLAWIRDGSPPRAWLGAYAVPADLESRERYGLPARVALVVEHVFPGSPADEKGLRRGDGLLSINKEGATTLPRAQERLLGAKPGETVALEIARGTEVRALTLTLAPRPQRPRLAGLDALRFFGGLELATGKDERLVVATLVPGSPLAAHRIAPGDVLLSILSKKDWVHGAKDNSRWRSVRTVADLESRLSTAYSDLDFCLGLRFRTRDGNRREMLLWEVLTPTAAL
jgi:S1-C subfamily serine protease